MDKRPARIELIYYHRCPCRDCRAPIQATLDELPGSVDIDPRGQAYGVKQVSMFDALHGDTGQRCLGIKIVLERATANEQYKNAKAYVALYAARLDINHLQRVLGLELFSVSEFVVC